MMRTRNLFIIGGLWIGVIVVLVVIGATLLTNNPPIPTLAVLPTNAPTAAATSTPLPTATITNTPPPTATITNTPLPTATPLPTNTPVPPTPIPPIGFSSTSEGMQPVIGPIDIPTGLYEVTATTNDFFIGSIEVVSGNCIVGTLGLFNLSQGQANDGAETLFGSENCRALIQISNTREPWTLEFRALGASDVHNVRGQYTSADEGLYAVIGPVVFADGRYRATVTTSDFFIGTLETIEGTCESGFLGLFNISQGQATDGAQNLLTSRDCIAIIVISNTREPWVLEFELLE